MTAQADGEPPCANPVPLLLALVRANREMRDAGFVLSLDGWRCRLVRPIDFELIREEL